MYIWRFPLFAFSDVVTTAALLLVLSSVLEIRGRVRKVAIRGLFLALAVTAVALSPLLVHVIMEPALREHAAHGLYIDPSPFAYSLPAAVAVTVLFLSSLLFPSSASWRNVRAWRAAFAATSLTFLALNLANWCSPGWCERFGFPLPYAWWSDAQLVFNGTQFGSGFSLVILLMDLATFLGLAILLSKSYRRPTTV